MTCTVVCPSLPWLTSHHTYGHLSLLRCMLCALVHVCVCACGWKLYFLYINLACTTVWFPSLSLVSPPVLPKLQQADVIINEECEELSDADGVVAGQYVKSSKVVFQTDNDLRKHEFGESPSSLQVDSPDSHPFASAMLYSVAFWKVSPWLGSCIVINREIC